jgi:hypothetical protein
VQGDECETDLLERVFCLEKAAAKLLWVACIQILSRCIDALYTSDPILRDCNWPRPLHRFAHVLPNEDGISRYVLAHVLGEDSRPEIVGVAGIVGASILEFLRRLMSA